MKARLLRWHACVEELSPEQVALLLSVGLVLGVFPVFGFPTVLCLVAAIGLRLNFPALQVLNNISSPLQFALLLPLERVGAWVCRGTYSAHSSTAGKLGTAAVHAIAGWACICVPLGVLLYAAVVFVMRKGGPPWFNSVKSPA